MSRTHWTLNWAERPTEEAALFNPAFCGELISRSATEYQRLRASSFPFAMAFVVLPLTLHAATRAALPGRSDTTFATWAAERGAMLAELPKRVLMLRPVTREALLFLTQHGALAVDAQGLSAGPHPLKLSSRKVVTSLDTNDARRAASLVGRWFAGQGSAAFVLQSLGIRP